MSVLCYLHAIIYSTFIDSCRLLKLFIPPGLLVSVQFWYVSTFSSLCSFNVCSETHSAMQRTTALTLQIFTVNWLTHLWTNRTYWAGHHLFKWQINFLIFQHVRTWEQLLLALSLSHAHTRTHTRKHANTLSQVITDLSEKFLAQGFVGSPGVDATDMKCDLADLYLPGGGTLFQYTDDLLKIFPSKDLEVLLK